MSKLSDVIRKAKNTTCSAIVVAAGSSTRMGEDKLLLDIAGTSVLERCLAALQSSSAVDEIILVTRADRLEELAAAGSGELTALYAGL